MAARKKPAKSTRYRTYGGVRYRLEPMRGKCSAQKSKALGIRCRTLGGKTYRLVEAGAETKAKPTPRPTRAQKAQSPKSHSPKPQPAADDAPLAFAVSLPPAAATKPAKRSETPLRQRLAAAPLRQRLAAALPWALAAGFAVAFLSRRSHGVAVPPLPTDARSGAQPMKPLVLLPEAPSDPPPGSMDPVPVPDPSRPPHLQPEPEPDPQPDPQPNENPTAVPGYVRAKNADVTSSMVRSAVDVLSRSRSDAKNQGWSGSGGCPSSGPTPCGTVEYFVDPSGRKYAILIEPHYHEPGGPIKPWGPHPGASVFVKPS